MIASLSILYKSISNIVLFFNSKNTKTLRPDYMKMYIGICMLTQVGYINFKASITGLFRCRLPCIVLKLFSVPILYLVYCKVSFD